MPGFHLISATKLTPREPGETTHVILLLMPSSDLFFFFFNDTATTEIYTLSLHDALPTWPCAAGPRSIAGSPGSRAGGWCPGAGRPDRKSTRLNSSHVRISYAVFCLK